MTLKSDAVPLFPLIDESHLHKINWEKYKWQLYSIGTIESIYCIQTRHLALSFLTTQTESNASNVNICIVVFAYRTSTYGLFLSFCHFITNNSYSMHAHTLLYVSMNNKYSHSYSITWTSFSSLFLQTNNASMGGWT